MKDRKKIINFLLRKTIEKTFSNEEEWDKLYNEMRPKFKL